MTPKPSTSLRVRFAKAMGHDTTWFERELDRLKIAVESVGGLGDAIFQISKIPDPTDANTVREALMGMTEEEWDKFSHKISQISYRGSTARFILTLPPPTLAELICEVRNQ